ncbi:hypothetical protein TRFO_13519 [Tritrichomonas foetus]|uniref:Uncharacterized protein n=1 Tax=Tritrichomonas foetus TaxID=1144522 RepID=A0A1J4KXR6_9EUKA|nr:hypothetical protein TRFO_13519 [Tritrichomonas foetus]|eukprot:OHT16031.1 hypothetical protein TRFO_13519 [Tritrichomonas foetus]
MEKHSHHRHRHSHHHHHHTKQVQDDDTCQKICYVLLFLYLAYIIPCFFSHPKKVCPDETIPHNETVRPTRTPKPTEKPIPTPEPTIESTPEPTPETTPEITPETTPEITPEPTPIVTSTPKPEQTPETTPTPVPTPTPTPTPTPIKTPEPQVIILPVDLPQEFLDEVKEFKETTEENIEKLQKHSQEISQNIKNIDGKLNDISQKVDADSKTLEDLQNGHNIKLPKDDLFTNTITSTLDLHKKTDKGQKLILVNMKSPIETIGVRALDQMLKMSPGDRYDNEIQPNHKDGLTCINGKTANFTYWTQYPLWTNSIEIEYPTNSVSNIRQLKIVAKLDGKTVFASNVINVDKSKIQFKFDKPIRFRELVIVALQNNGGNEVCIGTMSSFDPPRIGN